MARNPMTPSAPGPEVNLPVARLQEEHRLAASAEAYAAEKSEIARIVYEHRGRIQAFQSIRKLVTVAEIVQIKTLKESKQYKGLIITDSQGKSQQITTWEQFCEKVVGRSVESVDLDIRNLDGFGAELFEAMENIGIGPGKMRDLRQIPQEARQELLLAAERAATEAEENRKEAFLEVANELLAKSARDKQLLETQVASLKKAHEREMDAKQRVIEQKNQMTERLQRSIAELEQALHGKKTEAPDWDRRVGEARMQVTVHTGLLLQQADKLAWWREQLLTLMVHLDDAPARALAVDYLAKMEEIQNEVAALAAAGHDAFGHLAEMARLEGADYRLSELPEAGAIDGLAGREE